MAVFFDNKKKISDREIEQEIIACVDQLTRGFRPSEKKHDIIKYLIILGQQIEKIKLRSKPLPSPEEVNVVLGKIKQSYLKEKNNTQNIVLQPDAQRFYTTLMVIWCLKKEKDNTRRRLQKINHAGVINFSKPNRHCIKSGLSVLDAFVTDGALSSYIRELNPDTQSDLKSDINHPEYSQYFSAIEEWDSAIQSYYTPAQRKLKYFNYVLIIALILSGIGSTAALFVSLLKPWPLLGLGVSLLMITANCWVRAMSFQKTNCSLANALGYRGLGFTEWINESGKQSALPKIRRVILYFSLCLSSIIGFNVGLFIYTGMLNAQGTALFFLAYPPVALFFASALFISVMMGTFQLFLNTLRTVNPIRDLFVLPFKTITSLFDPMRPFNVAKSINALTIAQYISYSLFLALNVAGIAAILVVAYLGAQTFMSACLIPIGFSYSQAFVISYTLNFGLLPFGQLPFLIKTTSEAWGAPLTKFVYRAICGPLPIINTPVEDPNLKVGGGAFVKKMLTYLFSFFVVVEGGIRFYRQMHANPTLKMGRNVMIGCRTYLSATQTLSNFTKQEEDEIKSSRRELQVRIAENAVNQFFNRHQALLDSNRSEEEKSAALILVK